MKAENKQISIQELYGALTQDISKDEEIARFKTELVEIKKLSAQAIEVLSKDLETLKAEQAEAVEVDAD